MQKIPNGCLFYILTLPGFFSASSLFFGVGVMILRGPSLLLVLVPQLVEAVFFSIHNLNMKRIYHTCMYIKRLFNDLFFLKTLNHLEIITQSSCYRERIKHPYAREHFCKTYIFACMHCLDF